MTRPWSIDPTPLDRLWVRLDDLASAWRHAPERRGVWRSQSMFDDSQIIVRFAQGDPELAAALQALLDLGGTDWEQVQLLVERWATGEGVDSDP